MVADAVLDVGCATGALLHKAREAGHSGFLDASGLNVFLADAGFAAEAQYGSWARSPVTDASPEIITIARRHA